jgi:hypothetical protein
VPAAAPAPAPPTAPAAAAAGGGAPAAAGPPSVPRGYELPPEPPSAGGLDLDLADLADCRGLDADCGDLDLDLSADTPPGGDENAGASGACAASTPCGSVLRATQPAAAAAVGGSGGGGGGGAAKGARSPGSALKARPGSALAVTGGTPGTPTTRAALRRQQAAAAAAAAGGGAGAPGPAPVGEEEFASLPAWCSRQLSLGELNAALAGLAKVVAARCAGWGWDWGWGWGWGQHAGVESGRRRLTSRRLSRS